MRNHSLYFVLPSSYMLSQLIPEISKRLWPIGLGLDLVLVSTDSIVQICVYVGLQILPAIHVLHVSQEI